MLFKKAIEDMAAGSLRCVALAYKKCGKANVPDNEEELAHWQLPEDDLVLLAIVGLKVEFIYLFFIIFFIFAVTWDRSFNIIFICVSWTRICRV